MTCWDNVLDVLSVLISGRSACGITGSLTLLFNAKEESRKARQAICTCLEGLQTATRLSSILGKCDVLVKIICTNTTERSCKVLLCLLSNVWRAYFVALEGLQSCRLLGTTA